MPWTKVSGDNSFTRELARHLKGGVTRSALDTETLKSPYLTLTGKLIGPNCSGLVHQFTMDVVSSPYRSYPGPPSPGYWGLGYAHIVKASMA